MFMKINYLLTLLLMLTSFTLEARLARQEDFPFIVEDARSEITINKDGSFEEIGLVIYKVIKDEARDSLNPYKMEFDPGANDVQILDAYIENESAKITVNKSNIQISNSAAKKGGIVNSSEIAIPFSQIKTGSKVVIKYKQTQRPGAFGKYFSNNYNFGNKIFEKHNYIKIKSPRALFYKKNDPENILEVTQSKDKEGNFVLEATMKFPHVEILTEEVGTIPRKNVTTLTVTNIDTWKRLKDIINLKFSHLHIDPLPLELNKVIKDIPLEAPFEKKLETVLSYITSEYDYLGDWRGKGKYIPKSIDKIAADHFGDCKDFSTLLIRMLRELGIKSDYALVERTYDPYPVTETDLPSIDFFNHVIARVENDGKTYWVDPTNRYSIGLSNRYDISGRNAFVLGETQNVFEKIEKTNPEKNVLLQAKTYIFTSADEAGVEATYTSEGEMAYILLDQMKGKEALEVQEGLMKIVALGEHKVTTSFDLADSKSKSYHDIEIKAKYKANQLGARDKTSTDYMFYLPPIVSMATFEKIHKNDLGTIDLTLIPNIKNVYQYKNIFLSGNFPEVCDINTDWIVASRKIEKSESGFYLKDDIKIKKPLLTPKDFEAQGFDVITNQLYRCFVANVARYNYGSKVHSDKGSTAEAIFAKLPAKKRLIARTEAAALIIENSQGMKPVNDFTADDARMMLEKNLAESPKDSESLRLLGVYYKNSAYISGDDYELSTLARSLEFTNKALEADPKSTLALLDEVSAFIYFRRIEDAKNILYKEVLTIDKAKITLAQAKKTAYILYSNFQDAANGKIYFDIGMKLAKTNADKASMLENRARYYAKVKDNKNCILDYNESIKYDDRNAWAHGNLSLCYQADKQYDMAIAAAKKAISIKNYGMAHSYLADSYLSKGDQLLEGNKLEEAEQYYQMSLLESPSSYAYVKIMDLYLKADKTDKAKDAAKKALDMAGNSQNTLQTELYIRGQFAKFKKVYQ
jgi:tetratricopeptide (TPR) repeat protein